VLATVATNYTNYPNDQLSPEIAKVGAPVNTLYIAYSQELAIWELHNDLSMLTARHGKSPQAEE
jgi:hypothetical protein